MFPDFQLTSPPYCCSSPCLHVQQVSARSKGSKRQKKTEKAFSLLSSSDDSHLPQQVASWGEMHSLEKTAFLGTQSSICKSSCHSMLCSMQRKKFACMGLSRCHRIFWSNGNLPFRAAPYQSWPREVFSCCTFLLPSCPRELSSGLLKSPQNIWHISTALMTF